MDFTIIRQGGEVGNFGNFSGFFGLATPKYAPRNVKFGFDPLCHAKFHANPRIMSPRKDNKPLVMARYSHKRKR